MKRSKALCETNSDTSDNIDPQDIYALDEEYDNENDPETSQNSSSQNDAFNDLYPRNWSHGTCTCNRSAGRFRESSNNYASNLEQMQSKSFNNVGIGNVKTLKKRKVKKIYLPETEDRATGTFDLSLYKSNTNYHHFNNKKDYRRDTYRKSDKSVGHSFKRNALNTELSPYIQTKLKYIHPQSCSLGKNIIGKRLYNTFSIDNFINATTQINSAELGRARKIKIFKEREVNTETFDNIKLDDSESELSIDLSTVLSNKKPNDVSSVDSFVQHVYNLDKQRHNGNFSQISVDPMENILEREYRKMFSGQSRDFVYAKKSVSDSLLRRFEALRGSMSKNVPIRKISSQLTEPNYKDVTVVSDHQSIKSQSNVKKKPLSPLPSVVLDKGLSDPQASNKKTLTNTKTQNASKKPQSCLESGNNGVKGKFKLWGKILSTETSLKKSKLKCCLKGKNLQVVKSGNKISSEKSEIKKERNKFIFFKKRESAKAIKPKKAITTGRCEIREGLTLRIQKGCPKQNHKVRGIKEIQDNCENEDFPFYSWLDKLKFVDSWSSYIPTYLSLNNKSSSISNESSETNILLCKNGTTNTMSSSNKKNNPYSDFAKQYIQAWMIPNIILDGFGKTNIYCNLKCEKYDAKEHGKKPTKSILSKQETVMTEGPYKMYKTIYVGNASVEGKLQSSSGRIRCDIGLECISESKNNSYIRKHSDEKVYNIVNYETPLPSIITSKNVITQEINKRNLVTNDVITDMHVKNAKHKVKQAILKPRRNCDNVKLLNNKMSYQYNGKSVGDETLTQQNTKSISKRDHSGTNDYGAVDSFYPNAKKKLKYAEMYLRKFCHDCVPIDINAMCSNSVMNAHQDVVSSSQNVPVKDKKLKSYPKSPGDIRVSTIFSSCNAAANLGQELNKVKENFNGKKKDKSGSDAPIRILPKDSLEVFKKRQLYFNSNKNKWNELSMSVSSLSKRSDNEPPRSVKCHNKRVTISEVGSTIQCKRSLILKSNKNEDTKQSQDKGSKTPNKNMVQAKKEEDNKCFCERGCNTETSKDDNNTTTNAKMVDEERVDKFTNMPSPSDEEVQQMPKEVTAKSSKIVCVHKKESNEKSEDAGNLIEINLEVQRKPGEDKNNTAGVKKKSSENTKKDEKTKSASNNPKKSKNIGQDSSSKKIRSKNSTTYIKLRILIKNFNFNKGTNSKNPEMCETSKKTPQNFQSASMDGCLNGSDNIRSIYQLNSLNSFATFNDQNSRSDANLNLLDEQNIENSRNSEISCECVVSSQNSMSKQSIALYSKEENIENHTIEINGRRTICENFQHSKIAFKTHAYLNPYKKFISNYKLSNTRTKTICKHNEKYTSAQQAIQRMFECTQELKNNRKYRKMKKPVETARITKWRHSSHRKSKRSRIERMTQTCKLQLHSFSSNSKSRYNNHLFSNKKSDIKFHNYYCEVVVTSSKCRKSKSLICKSQKCLRKTIATTSGPSNLNSYKYQPPVFNPNCGDEYENTYQEISNHNITHENYCTSSSNINDNGDGNFKLKSILKTDYSNNSPKTSKYNIEESVSVERNCNEEIDVFELTEVKEAVLEMYVMEKTLLNSDLFAALPEFVNEVENNLRDSIINDYFQMLT